MKSHRLLLLLMTVCFQQVVQAQLTYETVWVQYDSAWTYKDLQLIPLRFKSPDGLKATVPVLNGKLISLPEAIQKGKVRIREVQDSRGASVNTLEIFNHSKDNILLNSGDLLAGGKQDRMIGETRILSPGKAASYVDVFCVEKGRWDDKQTAFKHKGTADISLKKVMDKTGRQSHVWKEIERQFMAVRKNSEVWPYLQLHSAKPIADSFYLRYFMDKYRNSDSLFAGFIAITKQRIISCELFSSTDMTTIAYPFFLPGFINDAVREGGIPVQQQEKITLFMDQLLLDEHTQEALLQVMVKYTGREPGLFTLLFMENSILVIIKFA
ncbi:hypothetical protein EXU57_22235 [Segetibacter sp. 3557_3]|uniref:ARPP-1 family domain-containing protein n=1 Tax=Segetibacter sp. 3557_3 TaxID=2547429 RepID=UPI001058C460|nr:DUF6569 family protein [Segetibacter sp. 3557_3]TDH19781.1 hypothetical protein EXU57_22235 [Segetibacter sp. 3557_3]